jgi:hypothetical protein
MEEATAVPAVPAALAVDETRAAMRKTTTTTTTEPPLPATQQSRKRWPLRRGAAWSGAGQAPALNEAERTQTMLPTATTTQTTTITTTLSAWPS